MLEISDHDHPEALEEQGNVVILDEVVDTVVEVTENKSYNNHAKDSIEGTLNSFSGVSEHLRPWPEVGSIRESDNSVDRVPTNKSTKREFCKVSFDPVSVVVIVFCDPRVTLVLVNMRSILVMVAVGLLPSPVRGQDGNMSNMTAEII